MSGQDPKLVALRFNDAINRRDLEGLTALMTEDHRFIDTEGHEVRGRDAVQAAWRGFFSAFPDYRNLFSAVSVRDELVFMLGHSECSVSTLAGPAIWTATIRDGRVAEWRVHLDNDDTRRSLGLQTGGLQGTRNG